MKRTCCLLISFLMLCCTAITAQSIYHFQYKIPSNDSAKVHEAFFVRNSSTGGFVRIIHYNTSGQPVITEMKLKEQFVSGTNSIIDPTIVY